MSDILSFAAAREHLRLDDSVADTALEPLIAAAESAIGDHLGRVLIDPLGWARPADVPANVVHAIKLVLADLYDDRNTPIADMTSVRNLIGRYVVVSIG